MQIKPAPFTNEAQGLPATGYAYHIGLPNDDPTNDDNKLEIKDGIDGSVTSNPFYIDTLGYFINTNGQRINPWIDEESYSIVVESPAGGVLYQYPEMVSDRVRSGPFQSSVVDAVYNNFDAAKESNLTGFETIYIESFASGWEDTVAGPIDGFYAHADGTTGTPSSGTPASFFDSAGNGWREDNAQRIGDDDVSTIMIQDNAITNDKMANDSVDRDNIIIPVGFPISTSVITASGTYNVPAGAKGLRVICVGSGGGGAGTDGATVTRGGAGGGGGAKAITFIDSPASSYTVTIGAAGAAGAINGSGGTGGATSFDTLCVADGGFGGSNLGQGGQGGLENACTGDEIYGGHTGGQFTFQDNTFAFVVGGFGGGPGGGSFLSAPTVNSGGGGYGGGDLVVGTGNAGSAGAEGKIIVEVY